ncbi:DgyrCDS13702 [Dimorphilus gyrociliatus]|uniref:DgyrCDS13702 n=1 Tax=Dimorphilus gyrociliatus TaxID=2664684 RepID=A0A7I8WBI5_9ANNE|nr:DgyrCDS13702 [Dimorphilus gyrociliatus]
MEKWEGKVALVTGASKGIGAAICIELVKSGMIVYGIARSVELIQALSDQLKGQKGQLIAKKCDLRVKSQILDVFTEIEKKHGLVHVVVNNASVSGSASIMDGETKDWRNMLAVNVVAPAITCQKAINLMMEKDYDTGHIINIGATSSHNISIYPSHHFWSATKYGLRSMTEGFSMELKSLKSHIKMTHISPGNTKTDFLKGKMMPFDPDFEEFKKFAVRVGVKEENLPKKNPVDLTGEGIYNSEEPRALKPGDVADYVIYALSSPLHAEVSELTIRPIQTY